MKKAGIVYFTSKGKQVAEKVENFFKTIGFNVYVRDKERDKNLSKWTGTAMDEFHVVVFVSATGIAVRTIAPFLKSKTVDPGVICIDDNGRFVIPLVSGHIGGANEMAERLAEWINGMAVVTTATDVNGKIAIDSWAKENDLVIESMEAAKECAMRLLEGKSVGLWSLVPVDCRAEGIEIAILNNFKYEFGINISWEIPKMFKRELKLVPKGLVLGIGCRRGTSQETIDKVVSEVLMEKGICFSGISTVATIDLKKDEEGLFGFCKEHGFKFVTLSAEELAEAKGHFPESEFVKKITGVDNVCQRAAVCACREGQVIIEKTARDGVTVSVAVPKSLKEDVLYVK